ncbi:MAG: translation initiation factor IF-3 [Phaeodactylibacter sp.]|nr:translation initiation factor IF-3 [Phaeodactylibacter sp.]MCB9264724.1 translation initiation factor IF-3 [Lewinellaceae bacterium]MCB9287780.1 translation initiation factor IF-3 [Lewinellaceae bacterium]
MAKRYSRRNDTSNNKFNFRVNEQIRVPEIRLVGDNLEEIANIVGQNIEPGTVYPTRRAKEWAEEAELDLVEISPNAKPPVVKIIDYNKFLYERKKKEKEIKAKAAKTVVKEIRFGPNTDDHDFDFKLRHAKKFLEEGAKVKAYVHFRGRTIVFKDRGELLLLRFLKELEDYGAAESLPKMEGRRMIVVVAPKKVKKK